MSDPEYNAFVARIWQSRRRALRQRDDIKQMTNEQRQLIRDELWAAYDNPEQADDLLWEYQHNLAMFDFAAKLGDDPEAWDDWLHFLEEIQACEYCEDEEETIGAQPTQLLYLRATFQGEANE